MQSKINVGMGEYKIASDPTILQTIGLGSCIAICLYDKNKKMGGLAHILLSESSKAHKNVNPLRFADKAIHTMLDAMKKRGCDDITAKIFGGSSMFPGINSIVIIGEKNIESVKEILKVLQIRVIAEDVGGDQGRSVWFDTANGSVVVSHTHGETVEM